MSPSNKKRNPNDFSVIAADPSGASDSNSKIKIFDGRGALCASGQGIVTTKLRKGLYTVRVERFGEMHEEVIVHRDKTDRRITPPRRNSAMPMSDTRHTHEFISGPAVEFSTKSTFDQSNVPHNWPRMMIMVRETGDSINLIELNSLNLMLYDENGNKITGFGPAKTFPLQSASFVIYSAQLKPGNYILASKRSERTHMLPISLYSGWDNLVFVPFQRRPRFSRSSIKMVRHNSGYNPDDQLSSKIDAVLLGLGSRLDLLNPIVRQNAIYGKFEHPLLGLIGAHSHFLSKDKNEKLESKVLRNLWKLMPGSPDVIAVLLMSLERDKGMIPSSKAELDREAKKAFGHGIRKRLPLSFPPMLSSALQAIMRATREIPDLVGEDSWLESAGNSSFGSGVWALWDQPTFADSFTEEVRRKSREVHLPSTQKLYPAVKRALANVSERAANEILAETSLDEFIEPTQAAIDDLLHDVEDHMPEFHLKMDLPVAEGFKTVRDLVSTVRQSAEFLDINGQVTDSSKIRPLPVIDNWLIDLVHDHIDNDKFDARTIAKQYAISKRSIEQAAKIQRAPRSDNDPI